MAIINKLMLTSALNETSSAHLPLTSTNTTTTNLEELQLNKTNADIFTASNETIGNNVDLNAINETMESIEADAAILEEYDNQYNSLIATQTDLETQCSNFVYPDVESIQSSSQAAKVIKDVEAQIQRIEQLIKTTQDAIKVLEEEKEVAQAQLEKREKEKAKMMAYFVDAHQSTLVW